MELYTFVTEEILISKPDFKCIISDIFLYLWNIVNISGILLDIQLHLNGGFH